MALALANCTPDGVEEIYNDQGVGRDKEKVVEGAVTQRVNSNQGGAKIPFSAIVDVNEGIGLKAGYSLGLKIGTQLSSIIVDKNGQFVSLEDNSDPRLQDPGKTAECKDKASTDCTFYKGVEGKAVPGGILAKVEGGNAVYEFARNGETIYVSPEQKKVKIGSRDYPLFYLYDSNFNKEYYVKYGDPMQEIVMAYYRVDSNGKLLCRKDGGGTEECAAIDKSSKLIALDKSKEVSLAAENQYVKVEKNLSGKPPYKVLKNTEGKSVAVSLTEEEDRSKQAVFDKNATAEIVVDTVTSALSSSKTAKDALLAQAVPFKITKVTLVALGPNKTVNQKIEPIQIPVTSSLLDINNSALPWILSPAFVFRGTGTPVEETVTVRVVVEGDIDRSGAALTQITDLGHLLQLRTRVKVVPPKVGDSGISKEGNRFDLGISEAGKSLEAGRADAGKAEADKGSD
ncbi:hypothetical protein A2276_07935 [candidate division WOR-1 bacterium RIFOXYA12_FULL_43_27]|uniref:Uncharacterized protein n=1 Tax=candidate division WOR-1 bacterium RIFOXYC2_FULL_46_14 TaxID=1802587 RepID=A0A1F4U641_UNCSA|nr:MAG: hypothetical protein A2276_07935 [candidate division WOR-1 bacterium RIFOXYA12_FULL_43_27]OGC20527.1 MAG: hypothetical protein A2292_05760 [candidate division WOR-1 bacterium RIFOXYB2_FULL_46_45]OGC31736.1 MAG: hypothetical protein A2232_05690 [candidate division WOR-1 bacterium RIFOXYA2_FULL_46_56]OGC40371.1 MAG: hypothetical protein A2438_03780 [candidate division WOR-1 bacterium RIFOXYC2_FULL_46_14]